MDNKELKALINRLKDKAEHESEIELNALYSEDDDYNSEKIECLKTLV